ncbi:MAG TPA: FAD-dependent oxidoreductase, partial [Thermohalobaculum sp.]|nr:FAD-dependent oxidoreductase [Thermohalobaculum sp.]
MAEPVVHIVGAGLAGLSTAVRLTERGQRVVVHEANPFAGGRCRSYHDPRLDRVIDNGNHLLLSGNRSALAYLATIGAADRMTAHPARFAFVDLADGSRWTIAPNRGPLPWWIFVPGRRAPGTNAGAYLAARRLALAGVDITVAQAIPGRGPAWQRFWEPLTLAAINATPEHASAALLWPVLRETFLRGAEYCRPLLAPHGLAQALVAPAVEWLQRRGAEIRFGRVLQQVECTEDRAMELQFADGDEPLGPVDRAVLALPPWRLGKVYPQADSPSGSGSILNLFYRLAAPLPGGTPPLTGVVSGTADWIFLRGDVASATISAAGERDMDTSDIPALIAEVWGNVRSALQLPPDAEPLASRINWERRATFDQTPAGN